ncbi:MAG: MscS family membrane protein, partial [Myxococcota bacterium]
YTLLYFLMEDDNYNPGRAAACIAHDGLERPASEAPELALRLKKILDARGLYVIIEDLPKDPEFQNEADEKAYTLFPRELPAMTWVRDAHGKWVLNAKSRNKIGALYRDTFPLNVDDMVQSLPSWMRGRVLGLQTWQFLALFLLLALAWGTFKLTVFVYTTYVNRAARRIDREWVRNSIICADRPVGILAMAAVAAAGFPLLQFPVGANTVVVLAARVLAAFSIVWLGFRLTDVLGKILQDRAEATESKLDDQLVPLVLKTIKIVLFIIGGLFILQNLRIDVGSLLAGLGIGGLAFALAAKDTVANLFGSFTIFVDKPFQIGDWIKIGSEVEGTVEEVGFRTSRVRTFHNSLISIPNSLITNSAVDNIGVRKYRRYKSVLGLAYDTSPERVQAFCEGVRAIIQATPGMRQDFYLVEFQGFGASSLEILLYTFMDVPDWNAELRARTNLNLSILELAGRLGVSFAFPTQTLHIESSPGHPAAPRPGPQTTEELIAIVREFGPRGKGGHPAGYKLTDGFPPGTRDRGHEADSG